MASRRRLSRVWPGAEAARLAASRPTAFGGSLMSCAPPRGHNASVNALYRVARSCAVRIASVPRRRWTGTPKAWSRASRTTRARAARRALLDELYGDGATLEDLRAAVNEDRLVLLAVERRLTSE